MHYAIQNLRRRGLSSDADLSLARAKYEMRHRAVRTLPVGSGVRLQGRTDLSSQRASSGCCSRGAYERLCGRGAPSTPPRRSQIRVLRWLSAPDPESRGRPAVALAAHRDRALPGGVESLARGALRSRPGGGEHHHAARRRTHPPRARANAHAHYDRRVRHSGRNPGAAELGRRRGVEAARSTPSRGWLEVLPTSTPISAHVRVDDEIHGCPVSKEQVLRVLARALLGTTPDLPGHSVCLECKRQGNVCVVVARGLPCMGPVTKAGCGALCPSLGRDCYGCFGPCDDPNPEALAGQFQELGIGPTDLVHRFRSITGNHPAFRRIGDHKGEGS